MTLTTLHRRTHSSCRPTVFRRCQGNFRLFKDTEVKITDTGSKGGAGRVLTISALDKDGIADREWVLTGETSEQVVTSKHSNIPMMHAQLFLNASALPLKPRLPAACVSQLSYKLCLIMKPGLAAQSRPPTSRATPYHRMHSESWVVHFSCLHALGAESHSQISHPIAPDA
jgi:hypothetical protein